MRSARPALLLAAAVLAVAAIAWTVTGPTAEPDGTNAGSPARPPAAEALRPPAGPAIPPGPGELVAKVRRATWLSTRPGRPAVARLLPHTEHGTPRVLSVVRREGDWLGVIVEERPNGRIGWIHSDTRLALARVRSTVDVDLGRRAVVVRRDGRRVAHFRVAVGAGHTPTPTGRFTVTDRLVTHGAATAYGCCVLALSGHQPYLEPGWTGGNRIAIHATTVAADIGRALSHGCIRATEPDMRRLLALTPPGALVDIHL